MNRLLLLIRLALADKELDAACLQELASWDEPSWDEVLNLAREQSVTGLVCHALSLVPQDDGTLQLPEDLLFTLASRAHDIERQARQMSAIAERLSAELSAAGFHPQVLKGPHTASFYPDPLLREYGDIDLYLPLEEWAGLCSMIPSGVPDPDGSFHFTREGVDVDVHRHWLDLPYQAEALPAWPSPEAELLMLSVHILKHAVGAGVGLRQVADLAAASLKLDYDPGRLRVCFDALHLTRWNRLVSAFMEKHLGVPNRMFPGDDISSEPLMRIIREGGNFGHYAASRSRALKQAGPIRKADTAFRFIRRAPFSLRYAPRLAFSSFFSLVRGNVKG